MSGEPQGGDAGAKAYDRTQLLLRAWELEAATDLQQIIDFLGPVPEPILLEEPELAMLLLYARAHRFDAEGAAALIDVMREPSRQWTDGRLQRRFLNFQGIVCLRLGQLDEAVALLKRLEHLSIAADDAATLQWATGNLGIISDMRCDHAEALLYYQRSLACQLRSPEQRWFSVIHHSLGMTYRQLGFFAESQSHFEQALRLPRSEAENVDLERALLMHDMGELEVAEALARRALERAADPPVPGFSAEAYRTLGKVAIRRRDLPGARQFLLRAQAETPAYHTLLQADVWEEFAVLELLAGNAARSAEAERESVSAYQRVGAPKRAERAKLRLLALRIEEECRQAGSSGGESP